MPTLFHVRRVQSHLGEHFLEHLLFQVVVEYSNELEIAVWC
jgi:predicted SAM-dependent methyltransferase